MPQKQTCYPIAEYLDTPEIRAISAKYGDRWETLNRLTKWALIGIWGFDAAAYASENLGKGEFALDPTDGMGEMLDALQLTPSEVETVKAIVRALAQIDETQQAQLVAALATSIAAGYFAETFADLFAG